MEQIEISGLNFSYPGGGGLSGIGLTVRRGEFVLLFGRSGSGKSTLLKQLKPTLAPSGTRAGKVLFNGGDIFSLSAREQSARIGFVSQDPENQAVTDKVWHELAFGLESLGLDDRTIRLRVAETASFFGIQNWFSKPVTELSGGQKQLLNLASVMVMQPELLLLDEPTSRLDPIAASELIRMLQKINEELGVTVILSEHRLDEVLPVCTRVLFLEGGRIALDAAPRELGRGSRELGNMAAALPACVRICAEFQGGETPVTVKEAKQRLEQSFRPREKQRTAGSVPAPERAAVTLEDVWFRYDRKAGDALREVSLKIGRGVFYGLVGGNGAGKSTLLSVIGGIRRPWSGKVTLLGRKLDSIPSGERYRRLLGCLPQEPQNLFRRSTVRKDLEETAASRERMEELIEFFGLEPLLERHPFDLSGGEQQCAALAKVLLTEPEILLLDEPTKGLDAVFKKKLAELLSTLKREGKTIVAASHDLDFCAQCADVCALMFSGEILSENETRAFFTGNSFYTTAANRIARDVFPDALTCEEVIAACKNERTTG